MNRGEKTRSSMDSTNEMKGQRNWNVSGRRQCRLSLQASAEAQMCSIFPVTLQRRDEIISRRVILRKKRRENTLTVCKTGVFVVRTCLCARWGAGDKKQTKSYFPKRDAFTNIHQLCFISQAADEVM